MIVFCIIATEFSFKSFAVTSRCLSTPSSHRCVTQISYIPKLYNMYNFFFFFFMKMGSTMKPTIFNDRVATALRNWHHTARKHIKQNRGSMTPMSSRPATPSHHMSPVHLLRHYRSELDSFHTSPRRSNFDNDQWDPDSPSPSHHFHRRPLDVEGSSSHKHHLHRNMEVSDADIDRDSPQIDSTTQIPNLNANNNREQHEIDVGPKEFSFDRRVDGV